MALSSFIRRGVLGILIAAALPTIKPVEAQQFGFLATVSPQHQTSPLIVEDAAAPGFSDGLFGQHSIMPTDLGPFPRWQKVMARFIEQKTSKTDCAGPSALPCPIDIWNNLVAQLRTQPLAERIVAVNEFFNRLPYVPAEINWHDAGYWETPFEFLSLGGQCQDYAIAKYLALLESGVPEENLRFVVVRDLFLGLDHAITVVDVNGTALALDNQMPTVMPIVSLQQRYSPYYSLNDVAWWPYQAAPTEVAAVSAGSWRAVPPSMQFANSFNVARY